MTKHMGNDPGNRAKASPASSASSGRTARTAAAATAAAPAPPPARAGRAKASPAEPTESTPTEPAFERGARVRVTGGPFAGKTGVVQAMVGRRSARVLFGPLPVQIDVDDLAPSEPAAGGRGRLRLSSSHRKPVPARS